MIRRSFVPLFLILVSTASSQWNWQTPVPQGNNLTGIAFYDSTLGWAVGEYGTMLHTTDGGASWYEQEFGRTDNILSVTVVSDSEGWAAGDNGVILHTTDGGDDWNEQSSGVSGGLNTIYFLDNLNGWAAGDNEVILHTTNGGTTWSLQHQAVQPTSINDITFSDLSTGWGVGSGHSVFHTTDGGTTWIKQTIGLVTGYFSTVNFADASIGIIAGSGGTMLRTDDGGTTWNPASSGVTTNINQVLMQNSFVGWATGDGGTLLKTVNGGLSWSKTTVGGVDNFNCIARGTGNLYIAGEFGYLFKSINSGFTWNELDRGSRNSVNWIDFPAPDIGAAVGQDGLLLRTTDAGQTWTEQSSPAPGASTYGVTFTDVNHGWAVGDDGTILRTGDGESWSVQPSGVTHTLFGIECSASGGWIVGGEYTGYTGIILRSTDGGNSWGTQLSGVSSILYGVASPDNVNGWAVGDNGLILHTSNGGANWSPQSSGITSSLYWCHFRDASFGWAVGDSGRILQTTNGGTTWNKQNSTTKEQLFSIVSSNVLHVIVSGDLGTILETTDGGAHWTSQYSRTQNGLFGIAKATDTSYYACGDYGTVLRSAIYAPPAPGVSGKVFNDYNGNGILDPGEPGIPGWRVRLSGTATDSALTGSDGSYSFPNLVTGPYTVEEVVQPPWSATGPVSVSFAITPSVPFYAGNFGNRLPNTFGMTVNASWNLLSIPVDAADPRRTTLFPTAATNAFSFSGSYQIAESLYPGFGYWVKFATQQSIGYTGTLIHDDTIPVLPGWNLVGTIGDSIPVGAITTIPPVLLTSSFFGYQLSYGTSSVLVPGRGYWVKCGSAGSIILHHAGMAPAAPPGEPISLRNLTDRLPEIQISDQAGARGTLYVAGKADRTIAPDGFALPPLPPPGGFDVRFGNNRQMAVISPDGGPDSTAVISVQSEHYPLTLSWNLRGEPDLRFVCTNAGGGALTSDARSGSVTITDAAEKTFIVRAVHAGGNGSLPNEIALFQNSPNPFNPSTNIRFALPEAAHVRLTVYNVIGEEIDRLADGEFDAGIHDLAFSRQVGSGIYFYRLEVRPSNGAVPVSFTKKMLLLK